MKAPPTSYPGRDGMTDKQREMLRATPSSTLVQSKALGTVESIRARLIEARVAETRSTLLPSPTTKTISSTLLNLYRKHLVERRKIVHATAGGRTVVCIWWQSEEGRSRLAMPDGHLPCTPEERVAMWHTGTARVPKPDEPRADRTFRQACKLYGLKNLKEVMVLDYEARRRFESTWTVLMYRECAKSGRPITGTEDYCLMDPMKVNLYQEL